MDVQGRSRSTTLTEAVGISDLSRQGKLVETDQLTLCRCKASFAPGSLPHLGMKEALIPKRHQLRNSAETLWVRRPPLPLKSHFKMAFFVL